MLSHEVSEIKISGRCSLKNFLLKHLGSVHRSVFVGGACFAVRLGSGSECGTDPTGQAECLLEPGVIRLVVSLHCWW